MLAVTHSLIVFFVLDILIKKIISSTVYVELYITKNDHIAGCDIIFISYS